MRMRKNQKGFTIVELLIAITILSIVVAVVCGFILVGSRSYAAGNSDINVQQEAQLALNQMSDVMIDTTRSVNYVGYDAAGNPEHALKDAEFPFTPEDKSLIMFNGVLEKDPSGGADTLKAGNGNMHYHFYWNKAKETLFYAEQNVVSGVVKSEDIMSNFPDPAHADPDADPTTTQWYVLAQHVVDFSVDLSQLEEKRVVQLALTFMDGSKEYVTSNNVTIRNKVGVNDAELAPLNRNVEVDVVVKPSVVLEPGETFVLPTPSVTGMNVTDTSVTWSFLDSPDDASLRPDDKSDETTLTTDGILTLSIYVQGSFKVKATANAENSDGSHSSAEITVNVKRVKDITLWKSSDSDSGNGPNEISPGCTFTISGTVIGDFLDQTCDACGEDTSIDRHILSTKSPILGGDDHVWRVWDPHLHASAAEIAAHGWENWHPSNDIESLDQDEYKATFRVKPNVSDAGDHGYVFQVMSLLSYYRPYGSPTYKGRRYDWVWPSISFTVVKSKEDAEPYGGKLQYGDQTLDESIREGLPTDYSKYVTAIRVVDNSGKEPDKVLLHYTIGGGNNLRIAPDLFDLDLNGSYTFYMQALFPIAEERYVEGQGGYPDDNETIRKEYFNNLNTAKPYGYVGTRYRHGKVFYAKLDRPKITIEYSGMDYKGKNITYDPVNIYMVGKGSGIIGEIKPKAYENIESNNGMNGMVYSLYEGKGNSQSGWKKWYYFDDSVMDYRGDKRLGGNVVEVSPGGNPFMKLDGDDRLQACGDYHVVPGMIYQNKKYDHYEIIGWQGFDYPNLPREERYYEFDESTIHVNVNAEFTMEINHSDFKGKVLFPLPGKMKNSPLFPNINNLDWQTSSSSLMVTALRDGNANAENFTFTYVRYRYVKNGNAWEVEPVRVEYRAWEKKILTHSYGIYKCGENGKKWECITRGGTTEKELVCNVKRFYYNYSEYQTYFPLPTDDGFPFADGTGEAGYEAALFDNNMQGAGTASGLIVTCKKNGDEYEIEFRKEERSSSQDNHKITVHYNGTYTWRPGQTEWTWKKRNEDTYKTDLVTNLEGVMINGTECKMYFPMPSESGFPFKDGKTEIECTAEHVAYAMTDVYGENAIQTQYGVNVIYTHSGNKHTITFVNRYYKVQEFGTFECADGATSWTKVK